MASLGLTLERWDRLPEFERSMWLERHRRREGLHSCGHPRDVCSDPDRDWFPQLTVCYPTMEQAAAQWRYDEIRKNRGEFHDGTRGSWSKTRSARHPYHYMDGVTIWASDVDHGFGGDFLTSGSQQREDEQPEPEQGQQDTDPLRAI